MTVPKKKKRRGGKRLSLFLFLLLICLAEAIDAAHLVVPVDGLEVGDAPVGADGHGSTAAIAIEVHAAVRVGVGVDGGDTVVPPAVQVVAERVPEALFGALALAVGVLAELDLVVGPVALGQAVSGGVDDRCEVEVEAGFNVRGVGAGSRGCWQGHAGGGEEESCEGREVHLCRWVFFGRFLCFWSVGSSILGSGCGKFGRFLD